MPDSIGILVTVAGGVVATFAGFIVALLQERASRQRVTTAEDNLQAQPNKVKPAWDLARATLEQYFNRNLIQISAIFVLSVIVMLAGFVVIIWGVSQSIQSPNILAPAVMATLAGVVTEFIGATFLFMYRSTVQQAMEYLRTLERINSVGMAMQILDTIPDDATVTQEDLKSQTKAQLVIYIMRQAHDLPTPPPPSTKG